MTTHRFAVAKSLACALAVCALSAAAQADDSQVNLGSQWWTQSARDAKYDEFSQVPRGGFLENFVLRETAGRNYLALWGANALRDDQATKLSLSNGVRFRADVGYLQIPHTFSHTARSPWVQSSAGWFTLPDSLQAKNQASSAKYAATMTDLLNGSPVIPLGFGTNITSARLRARPERGWQVEARGAVRERSGLKPYAMSFGFSTAIEIPEAINQRMVDADVIANYQHDRMTAQVDVGVSRFDNAISTLKVDNPKRVTDVIGGDGPKVGAIDLYPDNRVIRGSLALGYMLPRRTALVATLGISQGKQDDPFLPLTNNKALAQSSLDSLPARSLNAKATQVSGDVRLTTSPVEGLDGAVRFHYADYNNQTPSLNFIGQVPYDVSFQRYAEHANDVLSNKQWQAGVDLDYAVVHGVRLGGTYEYRVRDRTDREVEKDKESVFGARARLRPVEGVQINGKYSHGDRKLDSFIDETYNILTARLAGPTAGVYDSVVVGEQSALRRFDVANRVQDRADAGVAYALGEYADLSASYVYLKNDYKESKLGLQDETDHTVSSAGTIHVNDRLDLNGGYGFDWVQTHQMSRTSPATMTSLPDSNWTARLKDKDVFVFAGFEWWARPEKVSISANYQLSRHIAEFHLDNGVHTGQDLPTTIYRRHELMVETRYQWLKNTSIAGRYGWEEYDLDDWAVNTVPLLFPAVGASSAVFLGDGSQGYRAHRVALLVRHDF